MRFRCGADPHAEAAPGGKNAHRNVFEAAGGWGDLIWCGSRHADNVAGGHVVLPAIQGDFGGAVPDKPELVGIRVGLASAGAFGADAELDGVIRLGEDFERLHSAREDLIDLGAFHHVADLAAARPGAQQQKHKQESHTALLGLPGSVYNVPAAVRRVAVVSITTDI